jgi:CheY-like chemotaxis protein
VPLLLLTSGFMPPGHETAQLFAARLLKPARQKQLFDTLARCIATQGGIRPAVVAPPDDVAITPQKSVVLVVDDNAVNLKVACAMLTRLGYASQTAMDGQEAVEVVARAHAAGQRFGAVLMDVNMPRLNGLQATQDIRMLLGQASPAIIGLTAGASSDDRTRCLAAGMNDYLTKPLYVAALTLALERWVDQPGTAAGTPDGTPSTNAASPALPPARAEAPAAPLMDFERLAEFKEFDDAQLSMTRQVIALFRIDAAQWLEAIDQAIRANDAQALSWACHALVGAAGNVGAIALRVTAAGLEAQAAAGRVPVNARQTLDSLQSDWDKTGVVLNGWLMSGQFDGHKAPSAPGA